MEKEPATTELTMSAHGNLPQAIEAGKGDEAYAMAHSLVSDKGNNAETKRSKGWKVIKVRGNNALLQKEKIDVASRDSYIVTCALNYQNYEGMVLYDNGANESISFSVSSQAPQEIKDKLLQIAMEYFDNLE